MRQKILGMPANACDRLRWTDKTGSRTCKCQQTERLYAICLRCYHTLLCTVSQPSDAVIVVVSASVRRLLLLISFYLKPF